MMIFFFENIFDNDPSLDRLTTEKEMSGLKSGFNCLETINQR